MATAHVCCFTAAQHSVPHQQSANQGGCAQKNKLRGLCFAVCCVWDLGSKQWRESNHIAGHRFTFMLLNSLSARYAGALFTHFTGGREVGRGTINLQMTMIIKQCKTLRREHFSPTATRRSSRSPDISLSMLSCSVFLLMFLYSIKAVKDKIIILVIIGEALIYIFYRTRRV